HVCRLREGSAKPNRHHAGAHGVLLNVGLPAHAPGTPAQRAFGRPRFKGNFRCAAIAPDRRTRCSANRTKTACRTAAKGPGIWHSYRLLRSHRKPTRMSPKKTSFPKQDIRVLLLEGVSQTAVQTFQAAGYTQIEYHEKSPPEDELKARIAEAHIIGIRSRSYLTADVLAEAKRLIAIGCFCIGTNQVDLDAAELAGIPVFNAPYSNTRSVAELVVAQAVLLMRG